MKTLSSGGSLSSFSFSSKFSSKKDQVKEKILLRILDIKSIDHNYNLNSSSLLSYACEKNFVEVVKKILENDQINVNLYDPARGDSPLNIAIRKKNDEIIKLLVECPRINLNIKNYEDRTALMLAAELNHSKAVDLIISSERFDPKQSSLNAAFLMSTGEIAKKLLTLESLDVNDDSVIVNLNPQTKTGFSFSGGSSVFGKPPSTDDDHDGASNPTFGSSITKKRMLEPRI